MNWVYQYRLMTLLIPDSEDEAGDYTGEERKRWLKLVTMHLSVTDGKMDS